MSRSAARHRTTGRTDRLTPSARIAAAVELLEAVLGTEARPADAVANDYFRARRFIGSGDRRAVSDRVWRVLRSYRRLSWWLGGRPTPRLLVAASLLLEGARYAEVAAAVYSPGGRFAPAALAPSGAGSAPPSGKAARSSMRRCPTQCRLEVPDWLMTRIAVPAELRALLRSLRRSICGSIC